MENLGTRRVQPEGRPHERAPDLSDQLSPNQALHDSLGASESQRIGDNGPLGNPVVSFPDEGEQEDPEPGRTP
jgi:hypothetical protein